jgi:trehalose 6-phosphate phosphatase
VFDGSDAADEGRREALCTLGNGYMATRGARPESRADGVHYPGTYPAGCYDRVTDDVGGRTVQTESLVNAPNWLVLRLAARADGDTGHTDLLAGDATEQRVVLDMRRGLLVRRVVVVDGQGRRTAIRQRRFVHMVEPHVAGLQTVVTALNWSGSLRVESGVDGDVTNAGVARYRDMVGRHLDDVTTCSPAPDTIALQARTTGSSILVAEAVRTTVTGPDGVAAGHPATADGRVSTVHETPVRAGAPVTIEKLVAVHTSRDVATAHPRDAAVASVALCPSFDRLLEPHELAWDQLWRRFHLDLAAVPGDAGRDTLRTLRLCLFHVLQVASVHSGDVDAGLPARGLHGEGYRGHVFWDELFVLPVLTLRMPGVARSALLYRVRRLGAARRAARAAGRRGAMFPWQSGSDGREESPPVHLNPLSGRWLPDVSHLQRHVGLAVAYDVWQYFQATGNLEFLADQGAEVLLEIARFFADLTEHDPATDRYHIRGVMGPDEYSTRYPGAAEPGIDDNAYTNVMTVWLLLRARDTLGILPSARRAELVETLGLDAREQIRWHDITRRMYVPIAADGVISQFEGYRDLDELDWDALRDRHGDVARLDRILESEGRSVDDYQASKQADVLMLFYLLSADELRILLERLGYALPPEAIPATVEYYLARTAHGSTLSALVHAWVLARAHRDDAMEHFERALRSDVADIQRGSTAEGVHLGAMAGCIDLLQRCFAGLETRHDALWFNPHWPARLGPLEFGVQYRGQGLLVHVTGREVRVSAEPGPGRPVRVGCGDDVRELAPGQSVRFVAPGAVAGTRPGAPA